jgi:hypothetical protein
MYEVSNINEKLFTLALLMCPRLRLLEYNFAQYALNVTTLLLSIDVKSISDFPDCIESRYALMLLSIKYRILKAASLIIKGFLKAASTLPYGRVSESRWNFMTLYFRSHGFRNPVHMTTSNFR